MSYPLFVVFGSFVVPLVFTFKSVGEIHSTKLMTKAIQRASRAMLESVFATKITKDERGAAHWGQFALPGSGIPGVGLSAHVRLAVVGRDERPRSSAIGWLWVVLGMPPMLREEEEVLSQRHQGAKERGIGRSSRSGTRERFVLGLD